MSRISSENLLLVGKVTRPHGLKGFLRVLSYAHSVESFLNAGIVFIKSCSGELHEHSVVSIRPQKRVLVLKLKGLDSLDEAEKYREAEIYIGKETLTEEEEDEYFWYKLIGMKVYLQTGKYIGSIKEILPTGSNDIYVVREGKAEFLIPATHDVVKEVDTERNRMIITEVEGLLDLNEI